MSLDSVAESEEKKQKEKDAAVETLKEMVDRRQYKEARDFFNSLNEELHNSVRRDRSCRLYLREISFASL